MSAKDPIIFHSPVNGKWYKETHFTASMFAEVGCERCDLLQYAIDGCRPHITHLLKRYRVSYCSDLLPLSSAFSETISPTISLLESLDER